jgi:glutamyl-tRNA reductase
VIVNKAIYENLRNSETGRKMIIDLGVPANVDRQVWADPQVHYIDINSLKAQAEANMQLRKNEIIKCDEIITARSEQFYALHRERRIEIAFSEVPRQVKMIRELALKEVFAKDVNGLDEASKEVLDKVLSYMEKKYNAVAIKTAKDVFLEHKIQRKRQE